MHDANIYIYIKMYLFILFITWEMKPFTERVEV